jgi:transposase
MSKGLLRNKIPELKLALEGRVTEHHRFLLGQLYDHLRFTESKLSEIEQEIDRRMGPFRDEVIRLCTIPGVDRVTAWGLLAEIGLKHLDAFPLWWRCRSSTLDSRWPKDRLSDARAHFFFPLKVG